MTTIASRWLGRFGPEVSAVGLGCNNFGRPDSATETQEGTNAVIFEAIELGVTFFDTADTYGYPHGRSEELMGVALEGRRDQVVLASKFGHVDADVGIDASLPKGSRGYVRKAIDASLTRLRTDRIDLYQIHTPTVTPIEETIAALDELVTEGKVIAYGHSNFSAIQMREAAEATQRLGVAPFVSSQNEYNLLERGIERDVLPTVIELGLGFLPFFPLASGLLSGKFTRTERPADTRIMRIRPHVAENAPWDTIEQYERFCTARGVTMLQATFAWLLAQPGLSSVIAGVTSPEQLRQNVAAASAWSPTPEEIAEISRIFS
jgi:aryl-alcohol dehydrogenase-like predicted oxidoreductase